MITGESKQLSRRGRAPVGNASRRYPYPAMVADPWAGYDLDETPADRRAARVIPAAVEFEAYHRAWLVALHERLAGGGLADRVALDQGTAVEIYYGDGDGDGGKVCSVEVDETGVVQFVTSYDGGNMAYAYLLVDPMTGKAFGADGRPVIAAALYYAVRSLVETLDALDAVDLYDIVARRD